MGITYNRPKINYVLDYSPENFPNGPGEYWLEIASVETELLKNEVTMILRPVPDPINIVIRSNADTGDF